MDEHGDYLYRFAMVQVRNPTVAQDLVQDTLLAALRSRGEFGGRSSERSWLCSILKNKVVDHFRKLGRETSFTDLGFLSDEFAEKFIHGVWIHADAPTRWKPEADVVVHRMGVLERPAPVLGQAPEPRGPGFSCCANGKGFRPRKFANHFRSAKVMSG